MTKWLGIIGLTLLLGGCGFTQTGDFLTAVAKSKGAQAYDKGITNAEYYLCVVASVGSIKRAYFKSQESANTYNTFCYSRGSLEVVDPKEAENN